MSTFNTMRKRFPILESKVHLANCSQSPQSTDVLQALQAYLDNWGTKGMDWGYWMEEVNLARAAFAKLIHADFDEVAVVSSVSSAVASVASAFAGRECPHVITTVDEFPTVGHAWLGFANRKQLRVSFAQSETGFYGHRELSPLLQPDTQILSLHHVSYSTGARQDLKAVAQWAHKRHLLLFVDAYQSLGTEDINVHELDIDMLASGNLKFLLGLPGIAFLYVNKALAEKLQPAVTGWFGRQDPFAFNVRNLDYASGAVRFDGGTPPVLNAFAAKAGMDLLAEVGIAEIEQRIRELSLRTTQGALQRRLELLSPIDVFSKGATTAIKVPESHAMEVALAKKGIIVSARGDAVRIAPHFFTTDWEIDRALDELKALL